MREGVKENSRFYFNNIFLNLEGGLGKRADFINEYPLFRICACWEVS